MDPFPSVNKAYSMILMQRTVNMQTGESSEGIALHTKWNDNRGIVGFKEEFKTNRRGYKGRMLAHKRSQTYSHCGRQGHAKDTYFKIHGIPDWYKDLNDQKRRETGPPIGFNVIFAEGNNTSKNVYDFGETMKQGLKTKEILVVSKVRTVNMQTGESSEGIALHTKWNDNRGIVGFNGGIQNEQTWIQRRMLAHKRSQTYSHCGRQGHAKDTYFKIHGIPDWYKDLNDQKRRETGPPIGFNVIFAEGNNTSKNVYDFGETMKQGLKTKEILVVSKVITLGYGTKDLAIFPFIEQSICKRVKVLKELLYILNGMTTEALLVSRRNSKRTDGLKTKEILVVSKVRTVNMQTGESSEGIALHTKWNDNRGIVGFNGGIQNEQTWIQTGMLAHKRSQTYSHCGRQGHAKDTYFKIHGIPDWYKDLNDQKRRETGPPIGFNVIFAEGNNTSKNVYDFGETMKQGLKTKEILVVSKVITLGYGTKGHLSFHGLKTKEILVVSKVITLGYGTKDLAIFPFIEQSICKRVNVLKELLYILNGMTTEALLVSREEFKTNRRGYKGRMLAHKRSQTYSHCGRQGHAKDTYFKIHGIPDWYKDLNDQKRRERPPIGFNVIFAEGNNTSKNVYDFGETMKQGLKTKEIVVVSKVITLGYGTKDLAIFPFM
ncbi:hypothetical protein Sango_2427400 [Sesamum angolense]|uniref:Uncharacterized protein n=1 Tax=Sesamum angolense TaxID=2727404 RepID=A0AAE1W7F4_9LAMI|nr:hypothetical protein Sango_2427400 [Sesamum angolense]